MFSEITRLGAALEGSAQQHNPTGVRHQLFLCSSDADPNSDTNVWPSSGSAHVWDLWPKHRPAPWQKEIDDLMERQMTTIDDNRRKDMYDRVQELVWKQLPLICLVSPEVLVGGSTRLRNFRPSILSSHTLRNAEHLYSFGGLNTR